MLRLAPKFLLLVLGSAAAAGAAVASPADGDIPTAVVHYRTAALASDTGVRTLYHQLVKAAEQVCEHESTGAPLVSAKEMECRQKALSAAIEKVHNERLAALNTNHSKSG
jgi:UrcA family protein